jgi:hypothetical protein
VYNWKASGKSDSGFIAQEAKEVVPHLIHTSTDDDGTDIMSIKYSGYIPYLVRMNQSLMSRVEALETQLSKSTGSRKRKGAKSSGGESKK